jgi:hypothetical protein
VCVNLEGASGSYNELCFCCILEKAHFMTGKFHEVQAWSEPIHKTPLTDSDLFDEWINKAEQKTLRKVMAEMWHDSARLHPDGSFALMPDFNVKRKTTAQHRRMLGFEHKRGGGRTTGGTGKDSLDSLKKKK